MSSRLSNRTSTPRRNLASEIVAVLRGEIISGAIPQGTALAEPVLAARFGMSRAPVREALIELEREGLITFEATGRTRVRTLTEKDFVEIMQARAALEGMAARLAAARWRPEDSAAMEKNIAAQAGASSIAKLCRLDVEFHAYVMRRSGNARLLRLWQSIRWQFEMSLACTHRLQMRQSFKTPQVTINTHRRMLAALASGKPEVAGRTMAAQMEESVGWLHGEALTWETPPTAAPVPRGRRLVTRAAKLVLVTVVAASAMLAPAHAADYLKDIKPLLHERCYECHGAMKQKAKLRLDTVDLMLKGGKNGAALERGKPETSGIIERVTSTDDDERMPPKHEGTPLTAAQVALLREWIVAGAPAPADEKPETNPKEHWAFRPVVRPAVPVVANAKWVRNPIDAFLSKQHAEHGLTPQPEASRAVLLRRLYLDLIGLPPTPEEIAAFENDKSPDWYERVVNRLLDDKRHGERWARHWMDIWRYSDWWGLGALHRNSEKNIWHWRDWIVESVNDDVPYDEMVRQMLAADELYPNDLAKLRATGFLARNWFLFNRHQWMDETVEHVSKGFLGITMNCTKCHDHKYDPISQTDFYKLRAFFEPYSVRMDMVPGEADLERDGIPCAFDGMPDTPTYRFVRGNEANPDKSAVIAPGVPEVLAFAKLEIKPVSLPVEAWQPERRPWVPDAHIALAKRRVDVATAALATAKAKKPVVPADVNVAELLLAATGAEQLSVECRSAAMRAAWAKEGNATLATLERDANTAAIHAERQAALARARHTFADAELRLARAPAAQKPAVQKQVDAARAALGKAAQTASAPVAATAKFTPLAGARWTPTRFGSSTADDPVVTFKPTSTGRRSALAGWITDPRNPLTARVAVNHIWSRHMGAPFVPSMFEFGRKSATPVHPELLDWLASEFVASGWSMKHLHRLIVTSAAYRMSSSSVGGEASAAKDPDNLRWWRRAPIRIESQAVRDTILALAGDLDPTMGGPPVPTAQQDASKRRSLYFFHSNNERNIFLTAFDEADVRECYRRNQSIVPQQALALSNSALVLDSAARIAAKLPAEDDATFARAAFLTVLGVRASDAETSACIKTLTELRKLPDTTPAQARAQLVWALLNHNDFVTLR